MRVGTLLVRHGADERLRPDRETGAEGHTMIPVYGEMLLQVCREYPGLPDPRTLSNREIRFFYDGLRPELRRATSPDRKSKLGK